MKELLHRYPKTTYRLISGLQKGAVILIAAFCMSVVYFAISYIESDLHDKVIIAAASGNLKNLKKLATLDLYLSRTGFEMHETPLTMAILRNDRDAIDFLLSKKVDVNVVNDAYQSPLVVASQDPQRKEIVKLLIEHGAKRPE